MKIKLLKFEHSESEGWKFVPPVRKHYDDGGADISAPIGFFLAPGESKTIPLGFGLEIPNGYLGLTVSRSSGVNKGLLFHTTVIDAGYRGELHGIMTNVSQKSIAVDPGSRIGQIIIMPACIADFDTMDDLGEKARGTGGIGSTGE